MYRNEYRIEYKEQGYDETYEQFLERRLAEEEARNEVFENCIERGLRLWQAENPDKDYWIDGSQNIKWLLDKIFLLEQEIKNDR